MQSIMHLSKVQRRAQLEGAPPPQCPLRCHSPPAAAPPCPAHLLLPSKNIRTSGQKSLLFWPCNTEHGSSSCHRKLNFFFVITLLQFINIQPLKLLPGTQRKTPSKSNFESHQKNKNQVQPSRAPKPPLQKLHKQFPGLTAMPGRAQAVAWAQTTAAHQADHCRTPHFCALTNPVSRGKDGAAGNFSHPASDPGPPPTTAQTVTADSIWEQDLVVLRPPSAGSAEVVLTLLSSRASCNTQPCLVTETTQYSSCACRHHTVDRIRIGKYRFWCKSLQRSHQKEKQMCTANSKCTGEHKWNTKHVLLLTPAPG